MKNSFLVLCIAALLVFGCKASKPAETVSIDSATAITYKPVEIKVEGDTAKGTHNIESFNQAFAGAVSGSIIASGQNGRVKYQVIKKDTHDFHIEAVSEPVDTTVYVEEKTVTVKESRQTVVREEESWLEKLSDGVTRYTTVTLLIALAAVLLLNRLRK